MPTTLSPLSTAAARDDCRAVLVVVEHGNLHALPQRALDKKTFRSLNILQVDAAEGRLEACNDLDKLVWILLGNLDVENVDAGKLFEQACLTLHHRFARKRTDVAETEYRGAITDYSNQICSGGEACRLARIRFDREACIGNARRVSQR